MKICKVEIAFNDVLGTLILIGMIVLMIMKTRGGNCG